MNKIAIIEDDIDICNMIAKFLENNKYIVHYALNGAEGIELCKSLVPDLIILDIMLPKLNGMMYYRDCVNLQTLLSLLFPPKQWYRQK